MIPIGMVASLAGGMMGGGGGGGMLGGLMGGGGGGGMGGMLSGLMGGGGKKQESAPPPKPFPSPGLVQSGSYMPVPEGSMSFADWHAQRQADTQPAAAYQYQNPFGQPPSPPPNDYELMWRGLKKVGGWMGLGGGQGNGSGLDGMTPETNAAWQNRGY